MRNTVSIICIALLVSACASSSGVFQTGNNTYRIATRATWELGGRAGAVKMAMKEATAHCSKSKQIVSVINSEESYGHFEGGRVDLTFSCQSPDSTQGGAHQ